MRLLLSALLALASCAVRADVQDRVIPKWDPKESDGCSAPDILRPLLPIFEISTVRAGCETHDERYYYGGSEEDRLAADYELGLYWLRVGVPAKDVKASLDLIWIGGAPEWHKPKVSWAFGPLASPRFRYDVVPAKPAPP